MRSLILSQCRDLRIGVTREDLGALTTVRARQLEAVNLRFRKIVVERVTIPPIVVVPLEPFSR